MKFALILFLYNSSISGADSSALSTIYGFDSEKSCIIAGENIVKKFKTFTKNGKYHCISLNENSYR